MFIGIQKEEEFSDSYTDVKGMKRFIQWVELWIYEKLVQKFKILNSLKLLEIKLESILVYNSLNPVENVKHYDQENRVYINNIYE
jgi:hypothetical protein